MDKQLSEDFSSKERSQCLRVSWPTVATASPTLYGSIYRALRMSHLAECPPFVHQIYRSLLWGGLPDLRYPHYLPPPHHLLPASLPSEKSRHTIFCLQPSLAASPSFLCVPKKICFLCFFLKQKFRGRIYREADRLPSA